MHFLKLKMTAVTRAVGGFLWVCHHQVRFGYVGSSGSDGEREGDGKEERRETTGRSCFQHGGQFNGGFYPKWKF